MKYQLVVLGPNAGRYQELLGDALESRIAALGLDWNSDFVALDEGAMIDWKGSPVGVWFGGEDRSSSPSLQALQDHGAPVLPLVEDLTRFSSHMPDPLLPINGRQWDDERVPGDVLRCFRLTRELRQAFVSYRRTDSKAVADDLFEALSSRGYRVFLDTASVEATATFQDVLWDRMADMDLLVLLDSRNALNSRWVNEELMRVNQLGLGVLQLIWPDHRPFAGTDLSVWFPLSPAHFVNQDSGPQGRLTDATLAEVVAKAEEVRIRSLGARRIRVVDELLLRVGHSFKAHVHPYGPVKLTRSDAGPDGPLVGLAIPIVGLPDAWSIHQIEKDLRRYREVEDWKDLSMLDSLLTENGVRIVYDGLGVQDDRREFLVWLNNRLVVRTASFDRQLNERRDPLDEWLARLQEGPQTGALA